MKILITSHGGFADGLLDSLQMLMPLDVKIETISLTDEGIEVYKRELNEFLDSHDSVLAFVDLFGGTPFNSCYEYKCKNPDKSIQIVSGVNFPMLIQAVVAQSTNTLNDETLAELINHANEGIKWIK